MLPDGLNGTMSSSVVRLRQMFAQDELCRWEVSPIDHVEDLFDPVSCKNVQYMFQCLHHYYCQAFEPIYMHACAQDVPACMDF